eukprot:scaffold6969_cov92-Attheya_sp.AAC.1
MTCTHYVLSSEARWDAGKALAGTQGDPERQCLIKGVRINQETIGATPREPQVPVSDSEVDIVMTSVSSAYSDGALLQRLVSAVKIISYFEPDENEFMQNLCHQEQQNQFSRPRREHTVSLFEQDCVRNLNAWTMKHQPCSNNSWPTKTLTSNWHLPICTTEMLLNGPSVRLKITLLQAYAARILTCLCTCGINCYPKPSLP